MKKIEKGGILIKKKLLLLLLGFSLLVPTVKANEESLYVLQKFNLEDGSVSATMGSYKTFNEANLERRKLGRKENYGISFKNKVLVSNYGVVNLGLISNNHTMKSTTTGQYGYTNGMYGADAAFLGYYPSSNTIELRISGDSFTLEPTNVEIVPYNHSLNVNHYKNEGGILKHYIATNLKRAPWGISTTYAPNYLKENVKYYSYDGNYFYTDYLTMINDYISNSTANAVNYGNPFYNYYQYLPYRTQSHYGIKEVKQWYYQVMEYDQPYTSWYGNNLISRFNTTENALVESEQLYGANMLLTYGIGKSESGDGYSQIAQDKYNLFGHAAYDSSPYSSATGYNSNSASIYDHANIWMSRGYLNPADWRYNGTHLGNKLSGVGLKYASDPYWGEKNGANYFRFDKYFGGKDYNSVSIGLAEYSSIPAYKEPGDTRLFTLKAIPDRTFVILGEAGDWYKVQSDYHLNSDRNSIESRTGKYSFENDYVYINKSNIRRKLGGESTKKVEKVLNTVTRTEESSSNSTPTVPVKKSDPNEVIPKLETLLSTKAQSNHLSIKVGIPVSLIPSEIDGYKITLKNKNAVFSTGDQIEIQKDTVKLSLSIAVLGDVNGDGKISVRDIGAILNHIEGRTKLTGSNYIAGNILKTSNITVRAIGKILNYIERGIEIK